MLREAEVSFEAKVGVEGLDCQRGTWAGWRWRGLEFGQAGRIIRMGEGTGSDCLGKADDRAKGAQRARLVDVRGGAASPAGFGDQVRQIGAKMAENRVPWVTWRMEGLGDGGPGNDLADGRTRDGVTEAVWRTISARQTGTRG